MGVYETAAGVLAKVAALWPGSGQVTDLKAEVAALEQRLDAKAFEQEAAAADILHSAAQLNRPLDNWYYDYEDEKFRSEFAQMLHDPTVKAGMFPILLNLASLDLRVTPQHAEDETEKEIAEFVNWALHEVEGGLSAMVLKCVEPALYWQTSVTEKVYAPVKGGRWDGRWNLKALKSKNVQEAGWGFKEDRFRNVLALMHIEAQGINLLPPSKFLIYRFMPQFESVRGRSHLRAAYRAWWIKRTVQRAAAEAAQRNGIIPQAEFTNPKQRADLEAQMGAFAGRRWLVTPAGVKVTLHQFVSEGLARSYRELLEYCDRQILLSLQLATLQQLEGSQTGARNMGMVARDMTHLLPAYIGADFVGALRSQVVKQLVEFNYGAGAPVPALALEDPDARDMMGRVQIVGQLVKAGLPLSKKAQYRYFDQEAPADDGDVMKPLTPASPLAGWPPPGGGGEQGAGPGGGGEQGAGPGGGELPPGEAKVGELAAPPDRYAAFLAAYQEVKRARRAELAAQEGGHVESR